MDITKLIRSPINITKSLKEMKDNSLVTTDRLRIYIPVRFSERNLAKISSEIYICGICAIVNDNNQYGVLIVPSMIKITPTVINTIKVGEDSYYEFIFDKGSKVIENLDVLVNDTLAFFIFDEFFTKGRVPWYINYNDLGTIFDKSAKYANVNFNDKRVILELVASTIARNPADRYKTYRQSITKQEDVNNNPPKYIPLEAIQFTATNTVAKLAGAYMSDGVVSALVNPSEDVERIEKLLRT